MRLISFVLVFALGAFACGSRPRTEAVVVITNQGLSVPNDIDAVRLVVRDDTNDDVRHEQTLPLCHAGVTTSCFDLPLAVVLIPGPNAPDRGVRIEVNAMRGTESRIENAAVFHFTPDARLRLDFAFYPACLGQLACDATLQVCGASGACETVTPVPYGDPLDLAAQSGDASSAIDLPASSDLASADDLPPADLLPPPDLAEEFPHWRRVATLPSLSLGAPNHPVQAGAIGNTLYVFEGECNWIRAIDLTTGEIATVPTTNCPVDSSGFAGFLFSAANKLFFFSGTLAKKEIYSGTTWTDASNPVLRGNYASAVVDDGNVYFVGGRDSTGDFKGETRRYNATTDTWTLGGLASHPVPFYGGGATAVNGKVYVLGGTTSFSSSTHDQFYVFDPAAGTSGTWTSLGTIPDPTSQITATTYQGKIYYLTQRGMAPIRIFDTVGLSWSMLTPPPNAMNDWTRLITVVAGRLYHVSQRGVDVGVYEYIP